MKCRYMINLAFALVNIIFILIGCNCGDSLDDVTDDESGIIRINNGYATKDKYGNLTLKRCDRDFADCDGDISNGCETDLKVDINNCGKCGNVCPVPPNVANVACVNSVCKIDFCSSGYIDLDQKYENGCEYTCRKLGDTEIPSNMQDDDCDGFIDNVCKYTVDPSTYIVASDLKGKTTDIFSTSSNNYLAVAFVELVPGESHRLRLSLINKDLKVLFTTDIKELPLDCYFGTATINLGSDNIDVYWSENCNGSSAIYFNKVYYNGSINAEALKLYQSNEPITNLIYTEEEDKSYLSFETTLNHIKGIYLSEIDKDKNELVSMRSISTKDVDSYGHNLYIINGKVYVSYCEMRSNYIEVVIMENDLSDNKQMRFPIYKTEKNVIGTALGYGQGYLILLWTESMSSTGSMYLSVIDNSMVEIIQKKVDFSYDEYALPVIMYNGNVFVSSFYALKGNKGYVLFSDIDLNGKKISELIISPVSLNEKPYMSPKNSDLYVFYSDINSKMRYVLNMKRVYCEH